MLLHGLFFGQISSPANFRECLVEKFSGGIHLTFLGKRFCDGEAIAQFKQVVANDPRVEQVLLPLRDGLTIIRRK